LEQLERQKLASSIHDSPLQELAYVINVLDRQHTKGNGGVELQESALLLRKISRNLRDICAGLAPAWGVSIHEKLRYLVTDFEKNSEVEIDLQIINQLDEQDLDAEIINAIIHIVAESLNNIRKHSQASSATILLQITQEAIMLEICDDGIGLPTPSNNRLIDLLNNKHFGLAGMFEWARMANSELKILSPQDEGTLILLEKRLA
jgi:signal transduction histidine kinase